VWQKVTKGAAGR